MKRIAVALSGGVDSSVSAAILKSKGYSLTGFTVCLEVKEAHLSRKALCCHNGNDWKYNLQYSYMQGRVHAR